MTIRSQYILGHWISAVLVILVVAALSLRQIDLYPPTVDESFSMGNAGWWSIEGSFTAIDVLQSLRQNSSNHTPLFFLLLNLWGYFVGYDVAVGRVLTIFAGLLAMAMIYRLSRDFIAPIAGLFALIIISSNAFYNYYLSHVRMYPLLLLAAALVLWLYLRIIYQRKWRRAVACYALANTHAFNVFQHDRHLSFALSPQAQTLVMGILRDIAGFDCFFALDRGSSEVRRSSDSSVEWLRSSRG